MLSPRSVNYPNGPPPRSPGAWDSRAESSRGGSRLPERGQPERLRRLREQPAGSPRLRSSRRRRASSWDRSGGNDDRLHVEPGATVTLAEISGAGSINHVWITVVNEHLDRTPNAIEPDFLRRLLLRMYWDGEEEPSVLVPLGDFFGVGHAR